MITDYKDKARKLHKLIAAAESIAIIGHTKPDGDCVGSMLGLYNYIVDNYKDKTVDVYAESFPASFKILSGARKIKHEPADMCYELAISTDAADTERHGKFAKVFSNAITTFTIDHHVSNTGFGDICCIDGDSSSACEVICELLDMEKVSKETAEALYLGIVHDTGVFKYSSCSPRTMELAGILIGKGARPNIVIDETFYKKSYKQNLLMARTVLESTLYADGKIIHGYISKQTFKQFKATPLDVEGIVEQLRLTEGVEVAIFVYQLTKKTFKFSLRSKNYVDVSIIATKFGGGGHVHAAGFEGEGVLDDLLGQVISLVEEQLK
ncbi:MAG: DHH family phosphoesterase [Eubacterium sp.]|nr:DHH family phosphoesterase [Eubacterium sp.]SEF49640.1 phosphoesterase RecJ domain-containing protein [Eubacterium ruminantium]